MPDLHRRQLLEVGAGGVGDDPGQRGLAGAGRPEKIIEPTRSSAIARRRALPSPTTSRWPANSSSACGRTRCGSGACASSRLPAASANRSFGMAQPTGPRAREYGGQQTVRLGGMALRNGILVHSLDHWAAAVRTPEGELRLASGRKPEIPQRLLAVPGIRGLPVWPRSATCCRSCAAACRRRGCRWKAPARWARWRPRWC